jgi:hypothetical protein
MPQGRCAGCGETGSHKVITEHTMTCASYTRLFLSDPARALDPKNEYLRWLADDKGAERVVARQAQVDDTDARRAAMAGRFATRDPLEDE